MKKFDQVVSTQQAVKKAASSLKSTSLKEKFVNKFGVSFSLPASYIFSAKFCHQNPDCIVSAVKLSFPADTDFYDLWTTCQEQEAFPDEIYKQQNLEMSQSVMFKLMEKSGGVYQCKQSRIADPSLYKKAIVAMYSEDGSRVGLVRSFVEKGSSGQARSPSFPRQFGFSALVQLDAEVHEKHAIDIFDCSELDFFLEDTPISIEDRFYVCSIVDESFQHFFSKGSLLIRFSPRSHYAYVIQDFANIKVYQLQQAESSPKKTLCRPTFEIKLPSCFKTIVRIAIDEEEFGKSLAVYIRKDGLHLDVVSFEWLKQFDEMDQSMAGKMTKSKIHQLNQKHNVKTLSLQSDAMTWMGVTVISKNKKYLIHYSGQYTYLLYLGDDSIGFQQRIIQPLSGKQIRYIAQKGEDDFAIASACPISQKVTLQSAFHWQKKVKLPLKYVEGSSKILDIFNTEDCVQKLVVSRDDEEFQIFEVGNFQEVKLKQKIQLISLYTFEWPFLCYLHGSDEIIIQNAFSTQVAFYLKVPTTASTDRVSHLYLSSDYMLYYCVVDSNKYSLFSLDLERYFKYICKEGYAGSDDSSIVYGSFYQSRTIIEPITQTPIFTLPHDINNHQVIYKIIIKGASDRELIRLQQDRVIFVLQNNKLYQYEQQEMKYLDECVRFRDINEDLCLYLCPKSNTSKTCQLKYIKFTLSDYQRGFAHEEIEGSIEDFMVCETLLILLIKGQSDNRKARKLKVYTWGMSEKFELKCSIETFDKRVIGSFQQSEAHFNETICFGNKAYFIMSDSKKPSVQTYNSVLHLNAGERVLSKTPIKNKTFKRLLYCKVNTKTHSVKTAVIIPYLNENTVWFNPNKFDIQYNNFIQFPSVPHSPITDEVILTVYPYLEKAYLYNLKGQLKEKVALSSIYNELGEDILCVSPNCMIFAHLHNDGMEYEIISLLRITAKVRQVENDDNKTLNSTRTRAQTNIVRAGTPLSAGQEMKNEPYISVLPIENIQLNTILIQEEIFNNMKKRTAFDIVEHYLSQQCTVKVKMNDNLDISLGFLYKEENKETTLKDLMILKFVGKQRQAFFIRTNIEANEEQENEPFSATTGLKQRLLQIKLSSIYEDSDIKQQKYIGNCFDYLLLDDYIIVWSKSCIYFSELSFINSNTSTISLKKISFELPCYKHSGDQGKISLIQSPGQTDQEKQDGILFVMIKVLIEGQASFIKYDILHEKEFSIHEASVGAQCLYNKDKGIYLLDEHYLQCTISGTTLYQYHTNINQFERSKCIPDYFDKGSRFCASNKNRKFLIRNRYYLPYSYQTFMIFDEKMNEELSEENYDSKVVFTYNGLSGLHMFASNYQQLNFLLEKYEESHPDYLNMLLMRNAQVKTVLQLAIQAQNAKCVNLILSKLAKLPQSDLKAMKEDIVQLLEYDGFEEYLKLSFFQTNQMKLKTAMKIKEFDKEKPFQIEGVRTSFLDKEFYQKFGAYEESDEVLQRSVNISCVDVGWILQEDQGMQFLIALSESDNMKLFEIRMIRTLIFFLWRCMKPLIIGLMFVPFLLNFLLFNFYALYIFEESSRVAPSEQSRMSRCLRFSTMASLLLFGAFIFFIEFKQFVFHQQKYFESMWNLLDLIQAVLLPMIVVMDWTGVVQEEFIRPLSAVCILIFYLRFFYFLRLFDRSAPYVNIIVKITADIQIFMLVLVIAITGFGFAFYILSQNNDEESEFIPSLVRSFLYSYTLSVGDFNTDDFNGAQNEVLLWIVFLLASMFTLIILLNMLIAIMGDSYASVIQEQENQRYRDVLCLILENDFLFLNRRKLFENVKYLMLIEQDKDFFKKNEAEETYDKIRAMLMKEKDEGRVVMEKMFEHMNNQFRTVMRNLDEKIQQEDQ